mmetsp:Transcript_21770/g.15596  ORF Transcript_21770/g.15596 Transcript_21770/m.15596 type:complete len:191 (+) Transcript_21770:3877-4449(+)
MYIALLIITFFKFLGLGRMFDNLSYIVYMFGSVLSEIRWFGVVYLTILLTFAIIAYVLQFQVVGSEDYSGIGSFAFLLYSLRTSLGDFDVSYFGELNDTMRWSGWIMWLILVFVTTIILLNFLIAVISDVFEKVYDEKKVTSALQTLGLINEWEKIFMRTSANLKVMPYIVVRSLSADDPASDEWTGFLG